MVSKVKLDEFAPTTIVETRVDFEGLEYVSDPRGRVLKRIPIRNRTICYGTQGIVLKRGGHDGDVIVDFEDGDNSTVTTVAHQSYIVPIG